MPRIVKMQIATGEVDAYELDYETVSENWNLYKLPDGRTVRVKVYVSRISQVVDADGSEQFNADGSPFLIASNRVEIVASL
jgi:hypothetical protein